MVGILLLDCFISKRDKKCYGLDIHPGAGKNNSIEKCNDAVLRQSGVGFCSFRAESSLDGGLWEVGGEKGSRQQSSALSKGMLSP